MSEKVMKNALEPMAEFRLARNRSGFRPGMQIKSPKNGPRAVQFAGISSEKGDSF